MSKIKGGRWIGAGIGLTAGAALVQTVRNRDHTINDMQGPAFMPGGNPYSEGSELEAMMQMPQYQSSQEQGVTYQIRSRGGDSSGLANELASVTGGSVTGTTYDAPNPLQSRSTRERILGSY